MAKALGNGMPIGACWARAEVAAAFKPGDHATTFGGQPLAARGRARRARRHGARTTCPARGRRAGEPLTEGAARASPASPTCAASACCSPPSWRRGHRRQDRSPAACLDAGLVVNAVTPTALRFAPSLLVTDDEIDAAVAHPRRRCSRRSWSMTARHFLEVDDLSPGRARRGARRAADGQGRPEQRSRTLLAGQGVGAGVREAVGPHPQRRPRWRSSALGGHPIYVRPEEVGLDVRESVGRRRPHARRLLHACSAARVFDHARRWSAWRRWSTSRSSTCSPTGRTRCQALADLLTLGAAAARSRAVGSPTSATATTSPRRWRSAPRCPGVELAVASPAGLRARRRRRRPGPQPRRRRSSSSPIPTTRSTGPTRCTPTCGRRWGRRTRATLRRAAFAGYHGRRRAHGAAPAPTPCFLHCLPAHRGEEVSDDGARRPALSVVWQQAANRMHAGTGAVRSFPMRRGTDD